MKNTVENVGVTKAKAQAAIAGIEPANHNAGSDTPVTRNTCREQYHTHSIVIGAFYLRDTFRSLPDILLPE